MNNPIGIIFSGIFIAYLKVGGDQMQLYNFVPEAVSYTHLPSSSQFDSGLMARVTVYGDNDQVLYTSSDIHHNEKVTYFGAVSYTHLDVYKRQR